MGRIVSGNNQINLMINREPVTTQSMAAISMAAISFKVRVK